MPARPSLSFAQVQAAMQAMADRAMQTPEEPVAMAIMDATGNLVAYATMTGSPMVLDTFTVIFTPITVTGFFMGHAQWESKIPATIQEAARLVAEGVRVPIAGVYRLPEIKKAVEHSLRGGKVLLDVAEG